MKEKTEQNDKLKKDISEAKKQIHDKERKESCQKDLEKKFD